MRTDQDCRLKRVTAQTKADADTAASFKCADELVGTGAAHLMSVNNVNRGAGDRRQGTILMT